MSSRVFQTGMIDFFPFAGEVGLAWSFLFERFIYFFFEVDLKRIDPSPPCYVENIIPNPPNIKKERAKLTKPQDPP